MSDDYLRCFPSSRLLRSQRLTWATCSYFVVAGVTIESSSGLLYYEAGHLDQSSQQSECSIQDAAHSYLGILTKQDLEVNQCPWPKKLSCLLVN